MYQPICPSDSSSTILVFSPGRRMGWLAVSCSLPPEGSNLIGDELDEPLGFGARVLVREAGLPARESSAQRLIDQPGPLGHPLPSPGRGVLLRGVRFGQHGPEGSAHGQDRIGPRAGAGFGVNPRSERLVITRVRSHDLETGV